MQGILDINFFSSFILRSLTQLNEALPKVSYIKMLDVWLITMMMYPFFIVTLCTINKTMSKDEKKENYKMKSEWVQKEGEWKRKVTLRLLSALDTGLPIVTIVFVLVFLSLGITKSYFGQIGKKC